MPGIPKDTDLSLLTPQLFAGTDGALDSHPDRRDGSRGGGTLGTPLFEDDFSSGDFSKSENGFSWTYAAIDIEVGAGRLGGNAARFRYGPDAPGEDSTRELKYELAPTGEVGPTEIWVEYWLKIPTNFIHRTQLDQPNPGDRPSNNKFFVVYAEEYSKPTDLQVVTEYTRVNDTTCQARQVCMTGAGCSLENTGVAPNLMIRPEDLGEWVRVRIHVKAGNGDGKNEVWMDDRLVYKVDDYVHYAPGGNNYWRRGYIMGWSNSGYLAQTDFYLDEFKVYDQDPQWEM